MNNDTFRRTDSGRPVDEYVEGVAGEPLGRRLGAGENALIRKYSA